MSDLYTKLFHDILTSSIWSEDDKTRVMWVTVLALADHSGFVSGSIPGLATMARMSVKDAETVLDKLQSPDKYSRTEDREGRRIEKVDGGWFILNYGKYRERGKAEIRKEQGRVRQSRYRDSLKSNAKVTHSNASVTESNDPAIPIPYPLSSISGKEGGVGEEKQSNASFDAFWSAYPKKVGKKAALSAWLKAKDKPTIEDVLTAITAQKRSEQWTADGGRYIPNPATWINQGRWDDDLNAAKSVKPSGSYEYVPLEKRAPEDM